MADEKLEPLKPKYECVKPSVGLHVFMRHAKSSKILPAIITEVFAGDKVDLVTFNANIQGGCFGEKAVACGLKNGQWWDSLEMLKAAIEYERNPIDLKPAEASV
jgi:hypothetical protein